MTDRPTPRAPRLRLLSEDEIELWLTVAGSVARRPGSVLPQRAAASPLAPPALPDIAVSALPAPAAAKAHLPPLAPLERKLKQKLSRGRASAEAAIDLHGFRQDEALSALRRFLQSAQRDGLKVVLVVTGKGRSTDGAFDMTAAGIGVLRRAVPLWLAMPEFRPLVLGYEEAARSHGGSGALYVRLRRRPERA